MMASSASRSLNRLVYDRLDQWDARWFALRTAHRHEKLAERLLKREGIETFLPLQTIKKQYPNKLVSRERCLMPNYVFVSIIKCQEQHVYNNPYTHFLRLGADRLDINPNDIERLRCAAGDSKLDWKVAEKAEWQNGAPVELLGGHYTGWKGTFVRRKSKGIFVIQLESFLGLALITEVDTKYVAPLN